MREFRSRLHVKPLGKHRVKRPLTPEGSEPLGREDAILIERDQLGERRFFAGNQSCHERRLVTALVVDCHLSGAYRKPLAAGAVLCY